MPGIKKHRGVPPVAFDEPVYVTRPLFPDLRTYVSALEGIWQRRWLTNKGQLHDALEQALCDYLGASHLSLVANGTMALMLAYRAFELTGEVITTPFTSPATINALTWCGLTPVFADIDPTELTLDPAAISPRSRRAPVRSLESTSTECRAKSAGFRRLPHIVVCA